MKNSTLRPGLLAVTALMLAVMVNEAQAARPTDPPSVRVRYGDLDLTRDDGVQVLYARLRAAARQVCPDYGARSLRQRAIVQACFETSLANAVAAVRNDRLAALHGQKDGRARGSRTRIARND